MKLNCSHISAALFRPSYADVLLLLLLQLMAILFHVYTIRWSAAATYYAIVWLTTSSHFSLSFLFSYRFLFSSTVGAQRQQLDRAKQIVKLDYLFKLLTLFLFHSTCCGQSVCDWLHYQPVTTQQGQKDRAATQPVAFPPSAKCLFACMCIFMTCIYFCYFCCGRCLWSWSKENRSFFCAVSRLALGLACLLSEEEWKVSLSFCFHSNLFFFFLWLQFSITGTSTPNKASVCSFFLSDFI